MEINSSTVRMPRTLEQIRQEHPDSDTLRDLVGVLHEKLALRSRYAMIRYEAGQEGRTACFELIRALHALEQKQIERLCAVLASEFAMEVAA
jgi:hypothetical protein